MRSRTGKARERRGSMSVLMVVVLLGVLALVAFVVDMSRMHSGYSELQTEADAASLRGAQWIQRNTGANPTDSVSRFDSLNNWVQGDSVSLRAGDVSGIRWRPDSTPHAVEVGWGVSTNAVRVRAGRFRTLLFGSLLSNDTLARTIRGSAIAWVANVGRITCPTPWGFPVRALNFRTVGSTADTVLNMNYVGALQEKLATTGPMSVAMILYPSDETGLAQPNVSWPFEAIGEDNNMNDYPQQIANNTTCAADAAAQIGETEAFPGKGGGAIPQKTVRGAMGHNSLTGSLCEKNPPGGGADCYPVGSSHEGDPGVTVVVSWIGVVSGKSAEVETIGGFRVMCIFGKPNGSGKNAGGGGQSCGFFSDFLSSGYAPAGITVDDLPQGTIVGYPVALSPGLGNGSQLGNAPSLGQRLILVR